jgi:hypothetical protein
MVTYPTALQARRTAENSDRESRLNGLAWVVASSIMHDAGWVMPPEAERFYDRYKDRVWLCMAIASDEGWMDI